MDEDAANKDDEEEDQIAELGSPDVEIHEMDLAENEVGGMEDHPNLANEDEYIENIVEDTMATPINAATQTPRGLDMRVENTPMIPNSDGDKSEYMRRIFLKAKLRETKSVNKPTKFQKEKAKLLTKPTRSRENNSNSIRKEGHHWRSLLARQETLTLHLLPKGSPLAWLAATAPSKQLDYLWRFQHD
ncbi:unnamed protein product [Calypogeia fissa]